MNKRHTLQQAERTHLVYCVRYLKENEYILLNRDYKPLGMDANNWVEYADYPHLLLKFSPAERKAIHCGLGTDQDLHLFNDSNTPINGTKLNRLAYKKRLAILQAIINKYRGVKNTDLLYWLD